MAATNQADMSFVAIGISARRNGSAAGRPPGMPALNALSTRASYCASRIAWRMNATEPMPVAGYTPPRLLPNATT